MPLSLQALEVLKPLRSVTGDSPRVFPSARKKGSSINHAQKAIGRIVERSASTFSYDLEKRAALDFWGKRLEAVMSGKRGKVLAFGRR